MKRCATRTLAGIEFKSGLQCSPIQNVDNLSHIFLEPLDNPLASPCFHRLNLFHD